MDVGTGDLWGLGIVALLGWWAVFVGRTRKSDEQRRAAQGRDVRPGWRWRSRRERAFWLWVLFG